MTWVVVRFVVSSCSVPLTLNKRESANTFLDFSFFAAVSTTNRNPASCRRANGHTAYQLPLFPGLQQKLVHVDIKLLLFVPMKVLGAFHPIQKCGHWEAKHKYEAAYLFLLLF